MLAVASNCSNSIISCLELGESLTNKILVLDSLLQGARGSSRDGLDERQRSTLCGREGTVRR